MNSIFGWLSLRTVPSNRACVGGLFTCDCSCRMTPGLRPDPAVTKGPRGRCCSPGTPGTSSYPQRCCPLEPKKKKYVCTVRLNEIDVATKMDGRLMSFWIEEVPQGRQANSAIKLVVQ